MKNPTVAGAKRGKNDGAFVSARSPSVSQDFTREAVLLDFFACAHIFGCLNRLSRQVLASPGIKLLNCKVLILCFAIFKSKVRRVSHDLCIYCDV
jgi:hypothetical protein